MKLDRDHIFLDHPDPAEELELILKYQNTKEGPAKEALAATIIRGHLRFAAKNAREQSLATGIDAQEFFGEAKIGLIKALRTFDPTKGSKFISWAGWHIRETNMEVYRTSSLISHRVSNKRAEQMLEEKNPHKFQYVSLDKPIGSSDSEEGFTIGSLLPDEGPSPDSDLESQDNVSVVERALSCLEEREALIVRLHFGIGTGHSESLEEIRLKLGISKERTRQILDRAKKKLLPVLGELIKD